MLLNLDTERMTREESLAAARLLLEMAKSPRVFAGASKPDEAFNKFADDMLANIAEAFSMTKEVLTDIAKNGLSFKETDTGKLQTHCPECGCPVEQEPVNDDRACPHCGRLAETVIADGEEFDTTFDDHMGHVQTETTDGVDPVQPPALPGAQTEAEKALGARIADAGLTPDNIGADYVAPPTDVELADGLPWDSRIHGGGKTKLAGAPHGWKLKRRPQKEYPIEADWDAYVAEVTAELRALMAVAVPAETESTAAETFVQPVAPPKTETPEAPGAITNFAQLLQAITSHSKSTVEVTAACNQVDVPALPLLGARADLIPAVAAILFPVEP